MKSLIMIAITAVALLTNSCSENKLNKEETVFIDDSLQHVEGARRTGIHGIHLTNTNSLQELLKQILVD